MMIATPTMLMRDEERDERFPLDAFGRQDVYEEPYYLPHPGRGAFMCGHEPRCADVVQHSARMNALFAEMEAEMRWQAREDRAGKAKP
jgi:hypothetical protein